MLNSLAPRNQLAGKRNWQECDRSGSLKRDSIRARTHSMRGRRCHLLRLPRPFKENKQRTTASHNQCQRLLKPKMFCKRDQAHIPRGSAVTGELGIRREPGRKMRLKAHSQQHDLQRKTDETTPFQTKTQRKQALLQSFRVSYHSGHCQAWNLP